MSSADLTGGERYLMDLITHSSPEFEHHPVLPYYGPFARLLTKLRIPFTVVSLESKIEITYLTAVIRLIRRRHVHILHTHGYRATFYGRLASFLVPVKVVTTVHVSLLDYCDTPGLIRAAYVAAERMLSFRTDRFLCVSQAMQRDLTTLGIDLSRIARVSNGVDLSRFKPRPRSGKLLKEIGIEGKRPIIGTVGRLVNEKGHPFLFEALKQLRVHYPELVCLVIGDGPLRAEYIEKVSVIGVADVCVFTGSKSDIEQYYALMDLFVLPSIREPFGLVLIEAMATGVPVVATRSGGPREIIHDGYNGRLSAPGDPEDLFRTMEYMLQNPALAGEMAVHGADTVRKKFSIQKTVSDIERSYRSVSPTAKYRPS